MRHERAGHARLHAPRPPHDERHARSPLKIAVLAAAQWPGGFVAAELFDRVVFVAVVNHRAVVAGEDDQRVSRQLQTVERGEDFADEPVSLQDGVAARPHSAFARESRIRQARHVRIVRGEIKKEWFAFVPLDEGHGLARVKIGHVFIFPQRGLAAGHVADAADAVDDGHIVAVTRMHLQQFGILFAGGPVADLLFVIHSDRVSGVESGDAAVFDVNGRHAVAGRGHNERVIEPQIIRVRLDLAVPIRPALRPQAQMPFADHAG
ncbi:MAG: hypothetical protein JMDDDDMK_03316 [Acidobacteria bacterium]|nr:hypothetical protein [Acidobacteriota bacterium]